MKACEESSEGSKMLFWINFWQNKIQDSNDQILPFITHITFLNKNAPLNSSCIDILQYQFRKELWNRPVTKINFLLP